MKAMFYPPHSKHFISPTLLPFSKEWVEERTRIRPSWGFFLNSTPRSSNLLHSSSRLSTETQMCPKLSRFFLYQHTKEEGGRSGERGGNEPSSRFFVTVCVTFEFGIRLGTPLYSRWEGEGEGGGEGAASVIGKEKESRNEFTLWHNSVLTSGHQLLRAIKRWSQEVKRTEDTLTARGFGIERQSNSSDSFARLRFDPKAAYRPHFLAFFSSIVAPSLPSSGNARK